MEKVSFDKMQAVGLCTAKVAFGEACTINDACKEGVCIFVNPEDEEGVCAAEPHN